MGKRGPGALTKKNKGGRPRTVVAADVAKQFRALTPLAAKRMRQVLETEDAEQRHWIAAARIVAEVGGRVSDEPEDKKDNEIRVKFVDDWNAPNGADDSVTGGWRGMNTNFAELERQQAIAAALGSTVEEVRAIEAEAVAKRKRT